MWLNDKHVRQVTHGMRFCIRETSSENICTLRLRSEIVQWLERPLVSDINDADVIIDIDSKNSGSKGEFTIRTEHDRIVIDGHDAAGALYGFYTMLRRLSLGQQIAQFHSQPKQPIRMIDHWDQIDGSVERGYAGESIFFGRLGSNEHADIGVFPPRDTSNPFRGDIDRIIQYARFLASIGINAVALNNVNVRGDATRLILHPFLDRVKEIADIFSSFGVSTFLSVNYAAPKLLGGLGTSDPLADDVRSWWKQIADEVYKTIPAFGGFLVKADSEGEPGPMQYGRTHADGANMLADAVAPHGGTVIWRAFVYNSNQDWRDRTIDRAKAAYDNFISLDGQFDPGVVLQVKFGPIDFQTREPLTPLFGAMKHTNMLMEFEITAEYLGHQIDVNYVLPQWLEMINTRTDLENPDSEVKKTLGTNAIDGSRVGYAAVVNVGMDDNWTGNTLAQANLYGYGRMCWDDEVGSDEICREWIAQTFPELGDEDRERVFAIMTTSNATYEDYTAPLGVGFMVCKSRGHYGPGINDYEYDRWGTYHYADRNGVGVDRTMATGTGYVAQYSDSVAQMYEHLESIPDNLLLFFHHVPYTYRLHDGRTVIQHIYDTHFDGADAVARYIQLWDELRGKVPQNVFENVSRRLRLQLSNAIEWRDQINTYFYRMSGIGDERGRTIVP